MLEPCRLIILITCFVLCSALAADVQAEAAAQSSSAIHVDRPTCPSPTINYITQTVPQQWLQADRSRGTPGNQDDTATSAAQTTVAVEIASQLAADNDDGSTLIALAQYSRVHEVSSPAPSPDSDNTASGRKGPSSVPEGAVPTPDPSPDAYTDPLSDDANFLSFEDWKAQTLKKAGQHPDHVVGAKIEEHGIDHRRGPAGISNALDSLGDEGEIELDFSGFVNPDNAPDALVSVRSGSDETDKPRDAEEDGAAKRGKDAGTTSKERFNYASFDCAATVLKTNPGSKGSKSVLIENKDSYMINKCSIKNKFFIVELCNDILIDTVVLGNFEFFSSTFRTFRVSISDRYPVKSDKWRELGTFEARNTRGIQAFLVQNGLIWARYLRIELLTHYGNEYYCPISLLRVHGKTMMDDYRNEFKATRGDEDPDDDEVASEGEESDTQIAEVAAVDLIKPDPVEATALSNAQPTHNLATVTFTVERSRKTEASNIDESPPGGVSASNDTLAGITYSSPLIEQSDLMSSNCSTVELSCRLKHTHPLRLPTIIKKDAPATDSSSQASGRPHTASADAPSSVFAAIQSTNTTTPKEESEVHTTNKTHTTTASPPSAKSRGEPSPAKPTPQAAPATQESFFKSVHKRLQHLEANSTLSLQYIEEQSRLLREAFTKVEKRHLAKTTTFLDTLNSTVLSELREFRLQYDQTWQSTVLELSAQRDQSQRELVALSARLSLLADEILFQKRVVYLQFVLIVLCLGLIIFSRSPGAAYLELPILQNMAGKRSSFSRYLHLDSPPGTPLGPSSRYGLFSRGMRQAMSPSNETTLAKESRSLSVDYRPPTPVSNGSEYDETLLQNSRESEIPGSEATMRRAVSSPSPGSDLMDAERSAEDSGPTEAVDGSGSDVEGAREREAG